MDNEDANMQEFFLDPRQWDKDSLENIVENEEELYKEDEIHKCLEDVGFFDDVKEQSVVEEDGEGYVADNILLTLYYGDMCTSQGSGATFKFQGEEKVSILMSSSDTIKKLGKVILKHFEKHLAIEIRYGEELILESEGRELSFRDCDLYWIQDIRVHLRSPPADKNPADLSNFEEIEVIISAAGSPRFIIPVRLLGSVQDIKQSIKKLTSMDPQNQALCYKKKVLPDQCTALTCGLHNNSCIQVGPLDKIINVSIHGRGLKFDIKVALVDTVQVLKQQIQMITSIDKCYQKLYFRYQVLEEDCITACCGMFDNCHIQFVNIGQDNDPPAHDSTPGAAFNGGEIQVNLCYGTYGLPMPSHSFLVKADSRLNILKAEILKNVKKSLVLELPYAKEIRVSDQCDLSLASCQLHEKATIKVLLKWPYETCSRFSTRNWRFYGQMLRFKLRLHPEDKVSKLKEQIEMICGVKASNQKLLDLGSAEEHQDSTIVSQIINDIELRLG